MYWVPLTQDDLAQVFNDTELASLRAKVQGGAVKDALGDMVAFVRQCVAQNRSNRLSADKSLLPRSLRGPALDILALRLLKAYALQVTEPRKLAAEKAAELLEDIAKGKRLVLDEQGELPEDPAATPGIVSPSPAYGNEGIGWYPTPTTPEEEL